MQRKLVGELMDDPNVPPDELRRALGYIRAINRWMGGTQGLLRHLKKWSRSWPRDRPVTLLDIGTGSCDIPLAAVRWARDAGFDLRVTAVDNHEETLRAAREHIGDESNIELVKCDARELEARFGAGSFDYAHAGMFLHHLTDADAQRVVEIMHRVCRRGLVWNDLIRSRFSLAAVNLLLIGQPPLVKHDARASVAAGFIRTEAESMMERAGAGYAAWSTVLFHRFTLAGEKPGTATIG